TMALPCAGWMLPCRVPRLRLVESLVESRGRLVVCAAVWAALLLLLPTTAHAVKVRVRGSAALEGRVVPYADGVELRARVADDTNRPIGKAHVRLRIEPTPPNLPRATTCGNTEPGAVQR